MPAWIHAIETVVPDFAFSQERASLKMQEWARTDRDRRLLRVLYKQSGIERRHSVVRDFDGGAEEGFFRPAGEGRLAGPGTAARNDLFARESRPLAVEVARKALAASPGLSPRDVTHVVTVSCTGFYNPGPDYHIVRDLGLPDGTQRYHLGFMGCYAAFPALRMAAQFCGADPGATVLVVCVELCSLHARLDGSEDTMLANSLFSDGAAAAVVRSYPPGNGRPGFRLGAFRSALVPSGERDMTWSIGDDGFDIALSSYVPRILGDNIREFVAPSLAGLGMAVPDVDTWAVHPGGKSIVDQVRKNLGLSPEQVAASRDVLRDYGNMSSPTILFVLRRILETPSGKEPETVCALAFGPGLTVEMGLFYAVRHGAGATAAPAPDVATTLAGV